MTTNTDKYYIDKVCSGKTGDFSFLVEKYKNMVFTLALRMVKNREEAEEISQDAFVKAYKSLSKFKGDSKFSTWLYKITYNSCLDKLKSQKRMIKSDVIDKIHIRGLEVEKDALDYMDEKERLKVINNAINLLADEDKAIITLFYFNELSLQEVSDIVGTNPNTVKIRLYRSRKKLYTILKGKTEILNVRNYEE